MSNNNKSTCDSLSHHLINCLMTSLMATSCPPDHSESLLTSECSGHLANISVWDPHSGAALTTYKGHTSKRGTICLLGKSMLVSARPGKPVLNLWALSRHEQQPRVVTSPGALSAMAASPSGRYIVGASKDKIFVWQTCNGRLHRVLGGHFQEVTCLRFTDDGSTFVSAGKDGNVLVWNLLEAVSQRRLPGQPADKAAKPEPRFTWSDHRLEVTDVHVTAGGPRARVFTVSRDHTSKVYCLTSGRMLLDVSFAAPLSAVTVDAAETNVFLGSEKGAIYTYSLLTPPRDFQMTVTPVAENTFSGHTKAVTCLSVSADGLTLASGSDDMTVRMWSVRAKQFLRTVEHKGKLTEVRFIAPPKGMLKPEQFKQELVLANLEKTVAEEGGESKLNVEIVVRHRQEPVQELSAINGADEGVKRKHDEDSQDEESASSNSSGEVKKLKAINQELYQFAVKKILAVEAK